MTSTLCVHNVYFVAENAVMGLTETKLAIIPGGGKE